MDGEMTADLTAGEFTDEVLVLRAAGGYRPAFAELYRRYARRIYNLALRLMNCADEAQDMTQEVFVQAYKNLPRFEGRSSFYTWIYRVACNTCLQSRKRIRHRREEVPLDSVSEMTTAG